MLRRKEPDCVPKDVKQKDKTKLKVSPAVSSRSAENMHNRKETKKLAKLGRSQSTPATCSSANEHNIDLLSTKPNGTAVESEREGGTKGHKTTIRWMWKKAFKTLKSRDRDKESDTDKDADEDREDKKYSKMNSRQTSVKKGSSKQKDSKESAQEDDTQQKPGGEVDPVYSLLKCAADLPRQNKMGSSHACCLQRDSDNLTVRTNSRGSSPSSGPQSPSDQSDSASTISMCSCPCHTPELLAGYHLPFLNSFIIKKS